MRELDSQQIEYERTHEEASSPNETDYRMLGVTGVEDLLQDNVESCVDDFMEAGIKVLMVTGDKGATAHHIGISCGIFSKGMTIKMIEENSDVSVELNSIKS